MGKKYRASIYIKGCTKCLGTFATKEEAGTVRKAFSDNLNLDDFIAKSRLRRTSITREEIISMFTYNEETGDLQFKAGYKAPNGRVLISDSVGTLTRSGYKRTTLNCKSFMVHHLIWIMHYGDITTGGKYVIDHKNSIRNDNRLSNLRLITSRQNSINRSLSSKNTTGYHGVTYNRFSNKWIAVIHTEAYKQKQLGSYSTLEEAVSARKAAELKYYVE